MIRLSESLKKNLTLIILLVNYFQLEKLFVIKL